IYSQISSDFRVLAQLNLTYADLAFQPGLGLLFKVQNSSIALSFQRHILYWFLRVYDFLATFLTTGMRFLLNQQIIVFVIIWTHPVRTEVDKYVGIDYSLVRDPVVTSRSLDIDFRGMFFELGNESNTLVNYPIIPVVRDYDRMVYLALSEYFFDSGLYSYYTAGIFQMNISNEHMPKDLEMLFRTTYFGTIMMIVSMYVGIYLISLQLELNSAPKTTAKTSGVTVAITAIVTVMVLPPDKAPVQLSSMTMVRKKTSCHLMFYIYQLLIFIKKIKKITTIRIVDS
uniref:Phospholipid transfer protein n=1 Tax=Hucho hucho TaxID=62062 RepID=A0A4W5KYL8_9TELE